MNDFCDLETLDVTKSRPNIAQIDVTEYQTSIRETDVTEFRPDIATLTVTAIIAGIERIDVVLGCHVETFEILLETGDLMLTESGDHILVE